MTRRRPHSVFIGFRETAGYCANLKRGFDELGVRAVFVDLYGHPFGYQPAGTGPWIARVVARLRTWRGRSGPWKPLSVVLDRLAMVLLFAWAAVRFDAFILCSGSSFFALRDLPVLRLLGKRVIHVFFGSDSRPSYLNGYELAEDDPNGVARAVATTTAKRQMLRRIERNADEIVCHTLSAHLHQRPVVAFLAMGIPYPVAGELAAQPPTPEAGPNRPVRVLHAPSHPEGKGTPKIRAALAAVRDQGINLESIEIIGQPNAVVLAELARCDFVIDEIYSDTPMAVLAAEAAALGKPTIVGSYGWGELARTTPPEARPPSHQCHPDELAGAIRQLATDETYRRELGAAAHAFLRSRWSPATVAERFMRLIDGDAPNGRYEPRATRYIHGAGLSEDRLRLVVREVLAVFGREGLQVDDKPDLQQRLMTFAADG